MLHTDSLMGTALRHRHPNGINSSVLRDRRAVGVLPGVLGLILHRHRSLGACRKARRGDGLTVVLLLEGIGEEVQVRRRLFHRQLHGGHGRLVAPAVAFAQRIVSHTDGIFARGNGGKIGVFQRDRSVCGYHIISAVNVCIAVIQCRHGISVQFDIERDICLVKHGEAYRLGDRLCVGIQHHAVGVDNSDIAAYIRYTDVDERFSARFNAEICLTVGIKRQIGPVAGNGVLIRKRGFGQEVFNLFDTAAEIVSLHFHRLRLLEEQPEGDPVQEFLEAIAANVDLYLRCGNIRNALNGNNEVFAYIGNNEVSTGRIRRQLIEFITVHKHLKVLGLGIAVVDLNNKAKSCAVSDGCFNRVEDNGISCACGKRDIVNFIERNPVSHRVSCNVGRRDRMLLIVRLYGVFPVFQRNLFAVYPYGKVVIIGYGEIGGTVVFCVVLDAGNNRCFGIHSLHISAAAELLVGTGFPNAGVGVVYDLNLSCDADTTVNDTAVDHVLKSLALCEAVDKMLTVYGNICKFTTT